MREMMEEMESGGLAYLRGRGGGDGEAGECPWLRPEWPSCQNGETGSVVKQEFDGSISVSNETKESRDGGGDEVELPLQGWCGSVMVECHLNPLQRVTH